jgi:O-antigen/teichoic acid export membrane protein
VPSQPRSADAARHGSYRSGFAFGVLSFFAMATLGVVSAIVTARLYGARIIGEFALVSAPALALWVLSTAKEQAALIKEITGLPPRHPRITQLFAAVFTFSSALTVVMTALAAAASWLAFRGPLDHPELLAPALVSLAGYLTVANTGWNVDSIFAAFVAGRELFWVRLHETVSFLAIAVALGLRWTSVWGLVLAMIGGSLTALVHRIVLVRRFVDARLSWAGYREGLRALPDLVRFGLKMSPGSIAQGVSQQIGVWALAAVGGSLTALGVYSRAKTIPDRLQQINVRIVEVLYPTLVRRRAGGDGEGFDRALVDSTRYALIGMLLLAALLGGAAHAVLELFGPGFSRATTALALLAAYPALASITITQTQALLAANRPGLTSIIGLARLAVIAALTIALTPTMGIEGPALALIAGFLVDLVWRGLAVRPLLSRPLRATWPLRERAALLVAYAGGFGAAAAVEHALRSSSALLPTLLLSLAAGTLAYVAALLAAGVNRRDRARIAELLRGARSWRARRAAVPAPEAAAPPR